MPTKTKYPSQQWTKDQPEEPHDKELELRERQTPVLKIEHRNISKKNEDHTLKTRRCYNHLQKYKKPRPVLVIVMITY